MTPSGSPARIALVRHGETEWNAAHKYQGQVDIPLNAAGKDQAAAAADALRTGEHSWDISLVSPLSRARDTAAAITTALALPPAVVTPLLIERSFGVAEGMPRDEAHERWPEGDIPEAETLTEVDLRVRDFLTQVAEQYAGQSVIVVCHVVIIRSIVRALTGEDPGFVGNGSVTQLVPDSAPAGMRIIPE
ncbi:histidine phosphatase family protein [Mycetocola sp. JXN-3]|uniref:histidine phosphatase family protein n=1 Tax=Mycetocola sp. JXN-3 TaxID=2116510 RepID=UPI00165D2F37|nr:histidine phosphatase family protein [Mycetocola sp. JXN-3]